MARSWRCLFGFVFTCCIAGSAVAQDAPAAVADSVTTEAVEQVPERTLGDFLTSATQVTSTGLQGFYAEIPASLEPAVRHLARDNYTSAIEALQPKLASAGSEQEKARVHMWLGLAYGLRAMDYPSVGFTDGTSATRHLKQAIELDPEVRKAPDVARVMGEIIGFGWGGQEPAAALENYEKQGETSRDPLDFYTAGVISRRLSAIAWASGDTTEQDKRTLMNLARAVARDPGRYESWVAYLRSLMPVGLHKMATAETNKFYDHFKMLRTPVLGDQGPASLLLHVASDRTMQGDEAFLEKMRKDCPKCPYPVFELGMRAIETTPALAMEIFPGFVDAVASGSIVLEPREAGYLPSAWYKLGFLRQQFGDLQGALEAYEQVHKLNPTYAEVNLNLAVIHGQMSDMMTTGPKKLDTLRTAERYAAEQEKFDFRGRATAKAAGLRGKIRDIRRDVEAEMGVATDAATTSTNSATTSTAASSSTTPTQKM